MPSRWCDYTVLHLSNVRKYASRHSLFSVSDCLTGNCHLSRGNLPCMRSVAQHNCPWQSGSGESIWVRKDNPLTPKEDWRISQALMSRELVFISHLKNRAVCVRARALLCTTSMSPVASWVIVIALETAGGVGGLKEDKGEGGQC